MLLENQRILIISSNSSARGGGERYITHLTSGLSQLGCEVHVLLSDREYMDALADSLVKEGAVLHRKNLYALRQRPLRFIQSIRDINQINTISAFCREIAPAAILVNQQYDEDGLDYLMGALKSNVAPVSGLMHMPMTATKNQRPLGRIRGRLLSRWYVKHPYRLIFISEGAQKEFESYYAAPRPTYMVNHGISFSSATETPNCRIFSTKCPVVGFTGQFVSQKNLDCLIRAWLKVRKTGIECKLLLVGDGPERSGLESFLRKSAPIESWHITGWTASPENYLSEMDLFVMSSHFEGLPASLLETAGRGIPAVIAPFNGALDVAKRASWVKIASSNSVDEISQLITTALKNLNALKNTAVKGANDFQTYFSLKRMATEMLAVLTSESS